MEDSQREVYIEGVNNLYYSKAFKHKDITAKENESFTFFSLFLHPLFIFLTPNSVMKSADFGLSSN